MEPMIFTYSFTIDGYDVNVTVKFFPHIVVLEDSSPELMDDESESVDFSLTSLQKVFSKLWKDTEFSVSSLETEFPNS